MSPPEVRDMVLYQAGALAAFVKSAGARLQHIKPHGALYNDAAVSSDLAGAIVQAAAELDAALVIVGPPFSELERAASRHGLRFAAEVFADRTYQPDGTLTPRDRPDAFVHDAGVAAARVLAMLRDGAVTATSGARVAIRADTVCVLGDNPQALAFARQLAAALASAGVRLAPFGSPP